MITFASTLNRKNSVNHKRITPRALVSMLKATAYQIHWPDAEIKAMSTDTRTISQPAETLFFALSTQKRDGHLYLQTAYQQGVRNFVVSDAVFLQQWPDANVYLVSNALDALQSLGAYRRRQFEGTVVGIAGSNGKTIVKEWLFQTLSKTKRVIRSPRSYNSQIGVPLSTWTLEGQADIGLIEAGISKVGEMKKLAQIIAPNFGVFCHIGTAHDEGFASRQEKIAEKMLLFAHAQTLVSGVDDTDVAQALQKWKQAAPNRVLFTWSMSDSTASVFCISALRQITSTTLRISIAALRQTQEITVLLPFTDQASIENGLLTIASLIALGLDPQDIPPLIAQLEPVEMRLEMKAASHGCTILNDSYNSDLHSLRIAMEAAQSHRKNQKMTLVLSDLLQTGQSAEELYREVANLCLQKQFERVIGIGTEVAHLAKYLPASFDQAYFRDTTDLLDQLETKVWFRDELILLKGARIFAFERIAHRLQQKNHHAVLEVNLTAMTHNLNVYRRQLLPGVKLMVMVKAAGYGSGELETAKLLEHHGIAYLGVAYADEGITLRKGGIQIPIIVLNPAADEFDAMLRYQLEPEIYSLEILEALCAYAGKEKQMPIHIKLDTGMHRLGFESEQIAALCHTLAEYPNLSVATVFTHLAASDKSQFDTFTEQQVANFTDGYQQISQVIGYQPDRHVCNTGGITRFPRYQFEMVRLGIGLYGAEGAGLSEPLQVVHTLKARISQIKTIAAGQTVGYNRSGTVNRPTRIATINIGYADGLLRAAGGGRYHVSIGGQLAPTIGNICMDMCMVDITGLQHIKTGDEVIIFGEQPTVEDLAQVYQSISYEVFTSVSNRVKRVYWIE
jgi:Alr-MurF fusion protein